MLMSRKPIVEIGIVNLRSHFGDKISTPYLTRADNPLVHISPYRKSVPAAPIIGLLSTLTNPSFLLGPSLRATVVALIR